MSAIIACSAGLKSTPPSSAFFEAQGEENACCPEDACVDDFPGDHGDLQAEGFGGEPHRYRGPAVEHRYQAACSRTLPFHSVRPAIVRKREPRAAAMKRTIVTG